MFNIENKIFGESDMYVRPLKKLGQNFLINKSVAEAEAVHSDSKNILELGPGYGILTKELLKHAKSVVAVEKDNNLFNFLKTEIKSKKLHLLNMDFFNATPEQLMLDKIDIMISNIPYNLSSKTIEFLIKNKLEAVLCIQKEFADHMLAKENTKEYTKLSVISRLSLSMTRIMDVSKGNFRPIPKVDSAVIYIKPKKMDINEQEFKIINLLMQHKKRTVHKALGDSSFYLKMKRQELIRIANSLKYADERVFKLKPEEILQTASAISKELNKDGILLE
jgi:16S rRNA (adenine1518-N6/adenine1519-N6)-dimethyltransferase